MKYTDDAIRSLLQLFKVAPKTYDIYDAGDKFINARSTLQEGLLFLTDNELTQIPLRIYTLADALFGANVKQNNQTFYQSYLKVWNSDRLSLFIDQITHYLTTYALPELDTWLPKRLTEITSTPSPRITVIELLDDAAITELIDGYLRRQPTVNIALVKPLIPHTLMPADEAASFEVQCLLHENNGTIPETPLMQLRYLIYRITGETLLIKNKALINKLTNPANIICCHGIPHSILIKCDLTNLASIFLRYKPLFLALKGYEKCAPIINKIRRLADEYHKPLPRMSPSTFLNYTENHAINYVWTHNLTTREMIRAVNHIRAFRLCKPKVYNIRNGKVFVQSNKTILLLNDFSRVEELLLDRLGKMLNSKLRGLSFILPDHIEYAAPTSGKQIMATIPYGSYLKLPETFSLGVHWFNSDNKNNPFQGRVDLDLHLNSPLCHFGWNSDFRSGSNKPAICYSGDMTDAPKPHGAAESFFIDRNTDPLIVSLYRYCGEKNTPFALFATGKPELKGQVFDAKDLLFPQIPLVMRNDNETIGLINDGRFYFYGGELGRGRVPQANYADFINGLTSRLEGQITIHELLTLAGARIFNEPVICNNDVVTSVISLRPEDLTADVLLNIVDGTLN